MTPTENDVNKATDIYVSNPKNILDAYYPIAKALAEERERAVRETLQGEVVKGLVLQLKNADTHVEKGFTLLKRQIKKSLSAYHEALEEKPR